MDGLTMWAARYLGLGLGAIAAFIRVRAWATRSGHASARLTFGEWLFVWIAWPLMIAWFVTKVIQLVRRRLKETS